MQLEVTAEFPEVRLATIGPLMISVWYQEASLRGFEALGKTQDRLVAQYGMISSINISVILPRAPPPEAIEWVKSQQAKSDATTRETVVVLLSRGLSAVIARTFLATVSLFSRRNLKVVKTLTEAVEVIQRAPGQDSAIAGNPTLVATLEEFVQRPAPV